MGDQRPIGIFDSGVGGLTVLRAIREATAARADRSTSPTCITFRTARVTRTRSAASAFDIIRYLESRDVKLVVIACNTATAAALNQARELFEVPIVGVIRPGAQAAVDSDEEQPHRRHLDRGHDAQPGVPARDQGARPDGRRVPEGLPGARGDRRGGRGGLAARRGGAAGATSPTSCASAPTPWSSAARTIRC